MESSFSPGFRRTDSNILRVVKNGLKCYKFTKGKKLFHGTIANTNAVSKKDKEYYEYIIANDLQHAFSRPLFLSDKKTASIYGTKKDTTTVIYLNPDNNSNHIKSAECIPVYYKPGQHGVDIEFQIITEDILLVDIGNAKNISKILKIIDSLDATRFTNKFSRDNVKSILIHACAYGTKSNISSRSVSVCNRISHYDVDRDLAYIICNILGLEVHGWIYFGEELSGRNKSTFHGEVMLCNPAHVLQFNKIHTVPDTVIYDLPTIQEFMQKNKFYREHNFDIYQKTTKSIYWR